MKNVIKKFALVCAVTGVMAAQSMAALWSPTAGSSVGYTYTNGHDANGLYGNPTVGSTFVFAPSSFKDTSNDLITPAQDTVTVDVKANAGKQFNVIRGILQGDYSLLGISSVSPSAYFTVLNKDTLASVSGFLNFLPPPPTSTTSSLNGTFKGTMNMTLPAGWSNVSVTMTGHTLASNGVGGTGFMQFKSGSIEPITGTLVPEPTSLAFLAMGAGSLLVRRKNNKR